MPNTAPTRSDDAPLSALRRRWLIVALVYGAGLLLGWALLRTLGSAAWLWLLPVAALLAIQLAVLWWALPTNRPAAGESTTGAPLWPTLGLANWMTLMRGLLVGLLAGFIFSPLPAGAWAWLPALLYGSERLIDFLDGYVARVTGRASRLGSILDMEFDGLGILIGTAVAVQMGKLPAWYLLLGVARPLFVLGMTLRQRWGLPVHDLPPSSQRRLVAGVQTAFVSVMLWPPLPAELTHGAAILFALPLVASFGRDWLVVIGWLDAASDGYARLHARAAWLLEGWLPLVARVVGSGAAFWLLWQAAPLLPWSSFVVIATSVAALLFVLGAAGRVAALLLLSFVMVQSIVVGMNGATLLLLACATLVLHVGSGQWALWQPEERLFRTTLGAPAQAAVAAAQAGPEGGL